FIQAWSDATRHSRECIAGYSECCVEIVKSVLSLAKPGLVRQPSSTPSHERFLLTDRFASAAGNVLSSTARVKLIYRCSKRSGVCAVSRNKLLTWCERMHRCGCCKCLRC